MDCPRASHNHNGVAFLRWKRTNPMIVAHTLINAVAFIGYTLLAGHVSWLP
jgi:hypothetical protein